MHKKISKRKVQLIKMIEKKMNRATNQTEIA